MRKSLKKLKEQDELIEEQQEASDDHDKKKRKRKVKEREPNILGGGFVILMLILIFLATRAFATEPGPTKAEEVASLTSRQQEKDKALENVKNELQQHAVGISDNISNLNVMDSALASADKVSRDIDGAQELPGKTMETVKNMKIGEVIGMVVNSVSRLSKVYSDAKGLQQEALKQLEKL